MPWIQDGDSIDLFPDNFLLKRGCEIQKGEDQRLISPKGRVVILQLWGDMPYLRKSDLQRILEDLPEASAPGRNGTMLFEPTAARVCLSNHSAYVDYQISLEAFVRVHVEAKTQQCVLQV